MQESKKGISEKRSSALARGVSKQRSVFAWQCLVMVTLLILINWQHQFVDSSIMQNNMHFWQASKINTGKAKQISRANSDTVKVREFMPEHWAVHPYCSKPCRLHLQMANSNPSVMHDTQDGGHREARINGEEKQFQFKPGGVRNFACNSEENYWSGGVCTWELITLKIANANSRYIRRNKMDSPKSAEENLGATGSQKQKIKNDQKLTQKRRKQQQRRIAKQLLLQTLQAVKPKRNRGPPKADMASTPSTMRKAKNNSISASKKPKRDEENIREKAAKGKSSENDKESILYGSRNEKPSPKNFVAEDAKIEKKGEADKVTNIRPVQRKNPKATETYSSEEEAYYESGDTSKADEDSNSTTISSGETDKTPSVIKHHDGENGNLWKTTIKSQELINSLVPAGNNQKRGPLSKEQLRLLQDLSDSLSEDSSPEDDEDKDRRTIYSDGSSDTPNRENWNLKSKNIENGQSPRNDEKTAFELSKTKREMDPRTNSTDGPSYNPDEKKRKQKSNQKEIIPSDHHEGLSNSTRTIQWLIEEAEMSRFALAQEVQVVPGVVRTELKNAIKTTAWNWTEYEIQRLDPQAKRHINMILIQLKEEKKAGMEQLRSMRSIEKNQTNDQTPQRHNKAAREIRRRNDNTNYYYYKSRNEDGTKNKPPEAKRANAKIAREHLKSILVSMGGGGKANPSAEKHRSHAPRNRSRSPENVRKQQELMAILQQMGGGNKYRQNARHDGKDKSKHNPYLSKPKSSMVPSASKYQL